MDTGIFSRFAGYCAHPDRLVPSRAEFDARLRLRRFAPGCDQQIAIRSPHAIPQSAVIGSMLIGTVSGSGAANSMTVGSATISAVLVGAGLPPATAAAIENASSMGGQIMPPVMGNCRFSHGRISRRRLFRGGGARLGARSHLLRDGRGLVDPSRSDIGRIWSSIARRSP